MENTESAIMDLRKQGYSCSQATLLGIARAYAKDMPDESVLKSVSSAFRGGIGKTFDKGTCGALSGAIIALGLIYADNENLAAENAGKVYNRFKTKFGTVCCGDITDAHGRKLCNDCCKAAGKYVEEVVR